jgi:hypothetical protein
MNRNEFLELTPVEQEEYLSTGGSISSGSNEDVVSPPLVETAKEQVVEVTPTSSGVLTSTPQQPAQPIYKEIKTASGDTRQYEVYPEGVPLPEEHVYEFKDPVELLWFLDEDISTGRVTLHNWQVEFMLDFANGFGNGNVTQDDPFQALVRACNGSGKDKYCIAPCAVWLAMCTTTYASSVVTSSSGVQLDNQTCTYIEQLCTYANQKIHSKCWKINYRYYECLDTRSPIMCFATDEPGKAEGYHPLRYGAKMALFESEAKTVPDSIYNAQNKCTGYTHRAIVSTPGLPMGHFFDIDSMAIPRDEIRKGYKKTAIDYVQYLVTAYQCPHISRSYIEQMKRDLPGGELGAAFKSQVLAEFGTTDEMVAIPFIYVKKAINLDIEWLMEPYNKGGLDLSDGGDETVLVVRNGNKHLKTIPFRFDNTEDTVMFLDERFKENKLTFPESYIYGDAGGLGKPILDRLKRMGYHNIRYVDNRNKAYHPKVYLNRGTELYFHIRKLFEQGELIINGLDSRLLVRQLSTRYYRMDLANRHRLLSKLEQRSRGYPSPDRADAFTLAFWDYKSTVQETESENAKEVIEYYKKQWEQKPVGAFTLKNWAQGSDSPVQRLGKRPDTSYLLEQINDYNKQLLGKN